MTRLKSTRAARDLVKAHQPFRAAAERGPDGRWMLGWGHRAAAREGAVIRPEDAELLLIYDVLRAEQAIDAALDAALAAPQRDALVSFALDVGLDAFRQSAVVRLIGRGRWRDAADAIAAWGGGHSPRRAAERARFLIDLPQDAPRAPVELVIEFEHPDPKIEEPVAVEAKAVAPEDETSPAPDSDATVDEAAAPEAAEIPEATDGPETVDHAYAPAKRPRSEAAERVLARMRSQMVVSVLSAPEIEAEPAPEAEHKAEPELESGAEAALPAAPEDEPAFGRMGYVFDTAAVTARPIIPSSPAPELAHEPEAELEPEPAPEPAPVAPESTTSDAPPMPFGPPQASGLSGEAGADASEPANDMGGEVDAELEPHPEELHADMPDPEDIDREFARETAYGRRGLNGFSNGDDSAAPDSGAGWGVPSVFIAGSVVAAAGIWETFIHFDEYLVTESLWPGPIAVIAGTLLAGGAGVTMAGGALARAGRRRR